MLDSLNEGGSTDELERDLAGAPQTPLAGRVDEAVRVAQRHAAAVDQEGRFPAEAMAAIKAGGLLSLMVQREFGGEALSMGALADIAFQLGRACASTGMIFAMHQIKLANVVHYGPGNPWQEGFLRRVCVEQLLIASSTTEGSNGGNMRSTAAPMVWENGRVRFERDASVMSYGAEADVIITTARRNDEAASTDQVLAVFPKEDYQIAVKGSWNTLGMRGTCSGGFSLTAEGCADQVLAEPYEAIHVRSMMPTAHLLWGAVWTGIAAAAVAKAQFFVRKAARQSGGQMPPGAPHVAKAVSQLQTLRARVALAARSYETALAEPARLAALGFQTEMTLLKVEVSDGAVEVVMAALRACGLSGYRNDGEASVSRHLRDVLSSPLMINNDRILAGIATASLLAPLPDTLCA